MAILAFPLVISFLKPHTFGLSFLHVTNRNHQLFWPHHCFAIFAISTSSSSSTNIPQHLSSTDSDSNSNNNNEAIKSSVPTFQQAIQRLQVSTQLNSHFSLSFFFILFYFILFFISVIDDDIVTLNVFYRNIGVQLDVS